MTTIDRFTGTVYKVVNSEDHMIYIGSTSRSLSDRMGGHRSNARHQKKTRTSPLYQHMRKIGVDKFSIEHLLTIRRTTRAELEKAEYALMSKCSPEHLLNVETEQGSYCDTRIAKVAKALRKSLAKTKRGSIIRIQKMVYPTTDKAPYPVDTIVFRWSEYRNGRMQSKQQNWSVKKYGVDQSTKLATAAQLKRFPHSKHPKLIKIEKSKRFPSRGFIRRNASPAYWGFHWDNNNKRQQMKSFSVNKYGEGEAKRLAYAYRDVIYPINADPLTFRKEFIEGRVLKKMNQFREEFYQLADRGLIEVRASEKLIQYYERMVEVFQKHLHRLVDTDDEQRMQRFMNKALYAQEHAESYRTIIV